MKLKLAITATVISASLAGCGGGGGGGGGGGSAAQGGSAASCTPTMANPAACNPTMSMALVNGAGAAVTDVSPDSPGTLQALIKAWDGTPVAGVSVTFKTSDDVMLSPTSGIVKTDANGLARISLPAGTRAGSFTAEAAATVGLSTLRATVPYGTAFSSLSLAITDSAGAATTQVTPESAGTVQATVRTPGGKPVPNVVVSFKTSDGTAAFKPASGTALTDASGVARVGLPVGAQPGGFTVEATAAVAGPALKSSASYAAVFPALTLSGPVILPATISSRGMALIGVTVMNGSAPYRLPLTVTLSSECAKAGLAKLDASAVSYNGVALASYTDLGCGRLIDPITASVSLGGTQVTQTSAMTVMPASAGSITFVDADATNLALAGTGGFGRLEFSNLNFKVYDLKGLPVPNALVDFSFANDGPSPADGGPLLRTRSAYTNADGIVTAQVGSGTIPTSVRVQATVHGSAVSTLSNIVSISSGAPDEKHFTLGPDIGNCEGFNINQKCSTVTVSLADHFGNPVPDGTTVNFSAEGGVIDASCVTGSLPAPGTTPAGQTTNSQVGPGSGTCSVTLRSALPRPGDGRVTVMAYVLGEENFDDKNGNNRCDNCADTNGAEFTAAFDLKRDIFRDDDESRSWTPSEPCIGPNLDGNCSTAGDGKYNGVLRMPVDPVTPRTQYLSRQFVQVFSGSTASIALPASVTCPPNGTATVSFKVTDERGNLMPAATRIGLSTVFEPTSAASAASAASGSGTVTPADFMVDNVVLGIKGVATVPNYSAVVTCPASASGDALQGTLLVKVTTPSGKVTEKSVQIVPPAPAP